MDYKITDPEFTERMEHFAYEEVVNEEGQTLDSDTRNLAILATLLGCQGIDEFRIALGRALDEGLTPVMAKEVIYQAVDYLGIGRVRPFLAAANEILMERNDDYDGEPSGGRREDSGDDLRRWNEGSLEEQPHQPLAGGKLLRRLLHPERAYPGTA